MSARINLVILLTLIVLVGCGSEADDPPPPPSATPTPTVTPSPTVTSSPTVTPTPTFTPTPTPVVEEMCAEVTIPYETVFVDTENLEPGETARSRAGQNGLLQACERCITDWQDYTACETISRIVIREPTDEVVHVGVVPIAPAAPIEGRLAFISQGQAWLIEARSDNQRQLTSEAALDGHVFDLSSAGLLYTEGQDGSGLNLLKMMLDLDAPAAVDIRIADVLYASSNPSVPLEIVYSTGRRADTDWGWRAYNDLYLIRLRQDGTIASIEEVLEPSALGAFAAVGQHYAWSPDGLTLAWARPDAMGWVQPRQTTLLEFPLVEVGLDQGWVWVPSMTWAEGDIVSAVHRGQGQFDLVVVDGDTLVEDVGPWAAPVYGGMLAYFQSRNPADPLYPDYDLMVMEPSGAEPRRLFPAPTELAFVAGPYAPPQLAWSPSGQQVAVIYRGDIWIIDVASGAASRLTRNAEVTRLSWSE